LTNLVISNQLNCSNKRITEMHRDDTKVGFPDMGAVNDDDEDEEGWDLSEPSQ